MKKDDIIFGVLRQGEDHISIVMDMGDPGELYNALFNAVMSSEQAARVLTEVVLAMLGTIGMDGEDVIKWMGLCKENVVDRRGTCFNIPIAVGKTRS